MSSSPQSDRTTQTSKKCHMASFRIAMRSTACFIVAALLSSAPASSFSKSDSPKAELEQKLNAQFVLAQLTADKTDIVKPGSIFVLEKDGLLMCSTDTKVPPTRFYKDGSIALPLAGDMGWDISLKYAQPGATSANVPKREAGAGEKLFVSRILVKNEGVIFQFYSERYENVRYYGQLVFPYDKKAIPPAEDLLKTIAEVVTLQSPALRARRLQRPSRPHHRRLTRRRPRPRPSPWARQRIRSWLHLASRRR